MSDVPVEVRPLLATDWPDVERLFGERGACGGCWCMSWRVHPHGKGWKARCGEPNRASFRTLIEAGAVFGCLAFSGDEPVGWCNFGPRGDFPHLNASRKFATDWDAGTWAVLCFFIHRNWRRRGVALALLAHAVKLAGQLGAQRLEGFPVPDRWAKNGAIPAAFAWTGTEALFRACGFREVTPPGVSQPRYLHDLA